MITFDNGPAAGVSLGCTRTPFLVRAVHAGGDSWDALDSLSDIAHPGETIHVYRWAAVPSVYFIDYRGKNGRRCGERRVAARYVLLEDPPPDEVARDNTRWVAWCNEHGKPLADRLGFGHVLK